MDARHAGGRTRALGASPFLACLRKFEEEINRLGYVEYFYSDDIYTIDNNISNNIFPKSKTYTKTQNEIMLSFEVPYDWSIDTDWEDKALVLLGLCDEWVIDSSVEDK